MLWLAAGEMPGAILSRAGRVSARAFHANGSETIRLAPQASSSGTRSDVQREVIGLSLNLKGCVWCGQRGARCTKNQTFPA